MHVLSFIIIFQFHKGTIKPFMRLAPMPFPTFFQFHKGTIKPAALTDS